MTGSLPYNVWPKVVLRTGLFARCKETSEFVASGEGVALTPIFAKVEQPLKAAFATNDLRRICGAIDVAVPGYDIFCSRCEGRPSNLLSRVPPRKRTSVGYNGQSFARSGISSNREDQGKFPVKTRSSRCE
jgi:hypothetical protein